MRGFRRFLHIVAILISVLLLTTGCDQSTRKHVYRIGLGPWVGFGPLYLAKEKGFFKEAGVEVDLIVLTGIAERNSALKSGKLDALAAPVDYFVLSAGNGVSTTIVMAIDESAGGDGIVAKKSIQRFADLRGKKIAFQRGLPSEFFLRALLQQHGIKLDELTYLDMETAQGGAAFIAGKVDAAVLWEPWLTKAVEQGGGHVLASTKGYPDLIVDCIAFTEGAIGRSSDGVSKIVSALFKAIDYWKQNPEDADRIMAPYFQLEPAKYAAVLSGARFADLARNRQYFGTPTSPGPIFQVAERASKIWMEAKVTRSPVKPEAIISNKFLSKQGG